MLVLSRKKNQQILFTNLGIEVEILRVSGNTVSVGIKAPRSVNILRGELEAESEASGQPANKELQHTVKNQLHKAQLAVALAQKQLEMGRTEEAETTLEDMVRRLTEIDQQVTSPVDEPTSRNQSSHVSGTGHALLVEDDPNERALLAGYLRLCGFTVSEAADGIDAIEFLSRQRVDLVVLDVRMPRMNGIDTVRAIRGNPALRQTRVVIVSGEQRNESFMTGDSSGVSEWFSKPLNPERLVEHLGTGLN